MRRTLIHLKILPILGFDGIPNLGFESSVMQKSLTRISYTNFQGLIFRQLSNLESESFKMLNQIQILEFECKFSLIFQIYELDFEFFQLKKGYDNNVGNNKSFIRESISSFIEISNCSWNTQIRHQNPHRFQNLNTI